MRPDVQRILTKLAKEKVELSMRDDVIKYEKRGQDLRRQALKSLNNTIEIYEAAKQNQGIALDSSQKALASSKELGADEFIKFFEKSINFNKGTIKTIDKAINNLKSSRIA